MESRRRAQEHTGERTVTVAPERLGRWLTSFQERHGRISASQDGKHVIMVAADRAQAMITVPFPPLPAGCNPLDDLVHHVTVERRVGALLVRMGGYAVGVFTGDG